MSRPTLLFLIVSLACFALTLGEQIILVDADPEKWRVLALAFATASFVSAQGDTRRNREEKERREVEWDNTLSVLKKNDLVWLQSMGVDTTRQQDRRCDGPTDSTE